MSFAGPDATILPPRSRLRLGPSTGPAIPLDGSGAESRSAPDGPTRRTCEATAITLKATLSAGDDDGLGGSRASRTLAGTRRSSRGSDLPAINSSPRSSLSTTRHAAAPAVSNEPTLLSLIARDEYDDALWVCFVELSANRGRITKARKNLRDAMSRRLRVGA